MALVVHAYSPVCLEWVGSPGDRTSRTVRVTKQCQWSVNGANVGAAVPYGSGYSKMPPLRKSSPSPPTGSVTACWALPWLGPRVQLLSKPELPVFGLLPKNQMASQDSFAQGSHHWQEMRM